MTDATASWQQRVNDTTDQCIIDAFREHSMSLSSVNPEEDLVDLTPISDVLKDTRIIALGEATHGTREFFQLKHRLLRYLVTECDLRLIALEANFPEALAINEYVLHGTGDPGAVLEEVYFWTWQVESIRELLEWLREFNSDRPLADRVRFHGIDSQFTQGAVDALRDYFGSVDPEYLGSLTPELDAIADGGLPLERADDPKILLKGLDDLVPELREQLHAEREEYAQTTSERAWERARQHVRILSQAHDRKQAEQAYQQASDTEKAAIEQLIGHRNQVLATNVEWLLEYEDATQIAIWGHDAHINRTTHTHDGSGATVQSMGHHLAKSYGEDYYAIGFAFGQGSFQAMSSPDTEDAGEENEGVSLQQQELAGPLSETFEATLAELEDAICMVNLRAASDNGQLAEFLGAPRSHFSVGAIYDSETPTNHLTEYIYDDAFDAVCYVDETTCARPLDQEDE